MTNSSKPITECQSCRAGDLRSVLFLGFIPPVNAMPAVGERADEQPAYPLELFRCDACGLVQIGQDVDPSVLFPPSYPYRSNSTRILRENFAALEREATEVLGLKPDSLIVDIGSNDGTLLSNFRDAGYRVLGIEPSLAAEDANAQGVPTMMTFFGRASAAKARETEGPASLITAANVFAHITDVHEIIRGITELLTDDGVFISENHYLLDLVDTLQYDTVYHEHLRYYHVGALQKLFEPHGLEVFRVTRIPTHGGSVRVYAARKGQHPIHSSVAEIIAEERAKGITDGSALETFRTRVMRSKLDLHKLLADVKASGARVYGIGAPSRSSTLINYVGLDDGIVDAVMEVASSPKVNRYVPGTRIPVLDETMLYDDQPEYALFLSWHIADELAANLRKKGYKGKFITPLPTPRIFD